MMYRAGEIRGVTSSRRGTHNSLTGLGDRSVRS